MHLKSYFKVGDIIYLQASGSPIGLELSGAVSRPFMMYWDSMYLDKVEKAGMNMMMYERYIDDSNQVPVVPPPGSSYDIIQRKVLVNMEVAEIDEYEDERLSNILKTIANEVHEDIKMEDDHPGRHEDKKMPILDMNVWMDDDGFLVYQHYQKPIASTKVTHSQSAQSLQCKRSVHTQEILRRLLNSSSRLSWEGDIAPVISEYMGRMAVAGYSEIFRKNHEIEK